MEYELYIRRAAFDFLRQLRSAERDQLLRLLDELCSDPHRVGDFVEKDATGRNVEAMIFRGYAIFYWPDHAVKELRVIKIRLADR